MRNSTPQLCTIFALSCIASLCCADYQLDKFGQVVDTTYPNAVRSTAKERLEIRKIASQKLRQQYNPPVQSCTSQRVFRQGCTGGYCSQQTACQRRTEQKELQISRKMRELQRIQGTGFNPSGK